MGNRGIRWTQMGRCPPSKVQTRSTKKRVPLVLYLFEPGSGMCPVWQMFCGKCPVAEAYLILITAAALPLLLLLLLLPIYPPTHPRPSFLPRAPPPPLSPFPPFRPFPKSTSSYPPPNRDTPHVRLAPHRVLEMRVRTVRPHPRPCHVTCAR